MEVVIKKTPADILHDKWMASVKALEAFQQSKEGKLVDDEKAPDGKRAKAIEKQTRLQQQIMKTQEAFNKKDKVGKGKDCGCGRGAKKCISKKPAIIIAFEKKHPHCPGGKRGENIFRRWVQGELKRLDCGCGCMGIAGFMKQYGMLTGGALRDCPPGYRNDGLTCLEECGPGETDDGLFCRNTTCPPGWTNDGLTCREPIRSELEPCPTGSKDVAGTCWLDSNCHTGYFGDRLRGALGEDWGPKLETRGCPYVTRNLGDRNLRVLGGEVRGHPTRPKRVVGRVDWNATMRQLETAFREAFAGDGALARLFDPEKNGVANAFRQFGRDTEAAFQAIGDRLAQAFDPERNGIGPAFRQFGKMLEDTIGNADWWKDTMSNPDTWITILGVIASVAATILSAGTLGPAAFIALNMVGPVTKMIGDAAQGRPVDGLDFLNIAFAMIPGAGASASAASRAASKAIIDGVKFGATAAKALPYAQRAVQLGKIVVSGVGMAQAIGLVPSTCIANCPEPIRLENIELPPCGLDEEWVLEDDGNIVDETGDVQIEGGEEMEGGQDLQEEEEQLAQEVEEDTFEWIEDDACAMDVVGDDEAITPTEFEAEFAVDQEGQTPDDVRQARIERANALNLPVDWEGNILWEQSELPPEERETAEQLEGTIPNVMTRDQFMTWKCGRSSNRECVRDHELEYDRFLAERLGNAWEDIDRMFYAPQRERQRLEEEARQKERDEARELNLQYRRQQEEARRQEVERQNARKQALLDELKVISIEAWSPFARTPLEDLDANELSLLVRRERVAKQTADLREAERVRNEEERQRLAEEERVVAEQERLGEEVRAREEADRWEFTQQQTAELDAQAEQVARQREEEGRLANEETTRMNEARIATYQAEMDEQNRREMMRERDALIAEIDFFRNNPTRTPIFDLDVKKREFETKWNRPLITAAEQQEIDERNRPQMEEERAILLEQMEAYKNNVELRGYLESQKREFEAKWNRPLVGSGKSPLESVLRRRQFLKQRIQEEKLQIQFMKNRMRELDDWWDEERDEVALKNIELMTADTETILEKAEENLKNFRKELEQLSYKKGYMLEGTGRKRRKPKRGGVSTHREALEAGKALLREWEEFLTTELGNKRYIMLSHQEQLTEAIVAYISRLNTIMEPVPRDVRSRDREYDEAVDRVGELIQRVEDIPVRG